MTGTEQTSAAAGGPAPTNDHASLMNRTYRLTRHVYDASRRYFLLGRDLAIRDLDLKPGETLVELGCGTARNLIQIHKRYPEAKLYGVEISREMLATADNKLNSPRLRDAIKLHLGPAEKLDPADFGLESFDRVLFSYSLSMMPTWDQALDAALEHLTPEGRVHIVDFWDQQKLPGFFRGSLKWFLSMFHVYHRPELIEWLEARAKSGSADLQLRELYGRYAMLAKLERNDSAPA